MNDGRSYPPRLTANDDLTRLLEAAREPPKPPAAPPKPAPPERIRWRDPLAGDRVQGLVVRDGHPVDVKDRRGRKTFPNPALKQLPRISQLLVRGRAGALFKGGWTDFTDEFVGENVIVGAPIVCEMLQPGDGPGEVLLVTTAVTTYMLAARVGGQVNNLAVRAATKESVEIQKGMSRVHATLSRSMARSLAALEQMRAFKRNWDQELLPRAREDLTQGEVVDVSNVSH